MLAVFMIRAFTFDLVDHAARVLSPATAVPLSSALRRSLGVGNATGLGMAPFLVNHPALIDRWIAARETALARVRGLPAGDTWARLSALVKRARKLADSWRTTDAIQQERIAGLSTDLGRLATKVDSGPENALPFDALYRWAEENLGLEAQEMLVSLLIEPHGDVVDDLAAQMSIDEDAEFTIDGAMRIARLKTLTAQHYPFAFGADIESKQARARFWYVSEEKLEPRLGERYEEPGAEREQPLGIAQEVKALHDALRDRNAGDTVAAFLLANPGHRYAVRRVQIAAHHPYGEIQDNLLSADMRPIDLLRCKLACFGATKFDPKSDRWVRITLFQNAPLPEDIGHCDPDDWALPPLDGTGA